MLSRTSARKRKTGWKLGGTAASGAVFVLLLAVTLSRWTRVVVAGQSMCPTLLPGDRLLVRRGRRARTGDLVLVREPGGLEVVKRLAGVAGAWVDLGGSAPVRLGAGEVAVLGDHDAASTDSRTWGALPAGAVRGRVVATYHPADRARRW
jgi:signal peptidase I